MTNKHVAVVGSGPAGLAAAYYLRKAGHGVTVFDAMREAGGMLTYSIPSYRLPRVVVRKQIEALEQMGVEFVLGTTIEKDSLTGLNSDFDSTFLATGAWRDKSIDIEGAEYLQSGLEFLIGLQTCRQPPGEQVLVIGGGGVAIDVAVSALRLGAKRVTMACLESREAMPAVPEEITQALEEGVGLLTSWGPQRVLTTRGKVSGMELVRCTSVFDVGGRFNPSFDTDTTMTVDADCVLLAIGQVPDLRFADGLLQTRWHAHCRDGARRNELAWRVRWRRRRHWSSFCDRGNCGWAAGRHSHRPLPWRAHSRGWQRSQSPQPSSLIKIRAEALSPIPRVQTVSASPSARDIETEDVGGLDLASVEKEANRCLNCACIAVNVSDLAPALIALGAKIRTTKRVIDAEKFLRRRQGKHDRSRLRRAGDRTRDPASARSKHPALRQVPDSSFDRLRHRQCGERPVHARQQDREGRSCVGRGGSHPPSSCRGRAFSRRARTGRRDRGGSRRNRRPHRLPDAEERVQGPDPQGDVARSHT